MNGVVSHGQGVDGDGVLQGENRKFMIVDGGGRDGKIAESVNTGPSAAARGLMLMPTWRASKRSTP